MGLLSPPDCDLAHDKIPLVTYLPIVPLDEWLAVDGCDVVEDRARKEFLGNRNSALKNLGIAASIAESRDTSSSICDTFFPEGSLDKPTRQGRAKLLPLVEIDKRFRNWQRSIQDVEWLYSTNQHIKKSIVKEICHHRLSGYYFLPQIYLDDGSPGYVVLMREITNVSSKIAAAMSKGLIFSAQEPMPLGLAASDDMAMPSQN